MDSHRPYIIKSWFCAVLLAAAWPVAAQESTAFTKPTDLSTSKANDFMGSDRNGAFNVPNPAFKSSPQADFDVLPGAAPARMPSTREIQQWQKTLDERKNWMLLTPEQIIGVKTPEQIFGLPDPNHEENLSVEDKYIQRQERERNISATNAMSRRSSFGKSDNYLFQSQYDRQQQARQDKRDGANRLGMVDSSANTKATDAAGDADSIWHSAFYVVPPTPKPDLEQVAAMERFRAMEAGPVPEKPAVPGFASPAPLIDHNMQPMPAYDPAGHTYTSLQNNVGRPIGINPLPNITGQRPSDKAAKPKPLVKQPPWLADGPQSGVPPRAKF